MLTYLLQGVTLGFSAAVTPGPFQAYLIIQGVTQGWRRAFPAVFAPLLSDGPIIVIVLLVLAHTPDWFLRLLNLAGGLFLLYLAYGAFRAFQNYSAPPLTGSASQNIFKGALTNLLSPGPWLFWSVLAGPIFVQAWQDSIADAAVFLVTFYALLVCGNILVVILFSAARRFGTNVTRGLNGIAGLALLVFGVFQLWRGITGT